MLARYSRLPLRVAALRRSSREIVDGERPTRRAISRTPHLGAQQRDLLPLGERQITPRQRGLSDRRHPATLPKPPDANRRRHPRLDSRLHARDAHARSPPRTAPDAPAAPPAAAPANASPAAQPDSDAHRFGLPIATLLDRALRRPLESAQYTAVLFAKRCAKAGIEVSMGSVGDCYDNAVCETFHATIKKEKIYRQSWPTRAEARTAVFEYIEGWYNPRRRHSTLGYLSPIEFERQHTELARPALEDSISANGSVASTSPSTSDGPTTRRISTVSVDFAANGPISPDEALVDPTGPAQAATNGGQGTNGHRWPLRPSHRTSSLIQQSTTTAKTCRPNRGRSMSGLKSRRCCVLDAVHGQRSRVSGVEVVTDRPDVGGRGGGHTEN